MDHRKATPARHRDGAARRDAVPGAGADRSAAGCAGAALVAMGAHMRGGFTLAKLAEALRGMPRDARMLIRLLDGRLDKIDHVMAAHVADDGTALASGASTYGTRYGLILVAANPAGEGTD